jgi:hypothetical protein
VDREKAAGRIALQNELAHRQPKRRWPPFVIAIRENEVATVNYILRTVKDDGLPAADLTAELEESEAVPGIRGPLENSLNVDVDDRRDGTTGAELAMRVDDRSDYDRLGRVNERPVRRDDIDGSEE